MTALELWGGVECTVNRVGDAFRSQMHASGHIERLDDLDRFAELGIRRLRYPILWELTAPDSPGACDWRWADQRLDRLRALEIDPIVGLVHHGAGPRYTNLLDDRFAELLAAYAGAVAQRFPWVERYTPVNEPLTTARFSALYGCWHPHTRDDRSFVRALINECRGIVLAMQAIRSVNPAAQLIQTDDLGFTHSTSALAYQADFENERRWLAWDLICGAVGRTHPLHDYLLDAGVEEAEIAWFQENPCTPDVIGVNHYVTSDRYLDESLERYPRWSHGGNGKDRYADVEAVRAMPSGIPGLARALSDAWSRYRRPVVLTETHLGCTRDEQLRWLNEAWRCAHDLQSKGADIRAVTVWALLGSFDWNSLLTRFTGAYESGAFDVRGKTPRRTALAAFARQLARGEHAPHAPLLEQPGWWRRPSRLFPFVTPSTPPASPPRLHRKVLITGAAGTLGRAFARICELRGLDAHVCTRAELDICDPHAIARLLEQSRAWMVVNAAGYVRVDDAEGDCERCYRENASGAAQLALACAEHNLPFATFSSDLVFDGHRDSPYVESHEAAPLNVYGLSKVRAEREVMQAHPNALVVRTSAFFGPWDEHNFVTLALRALRSNDSFNAIDDIVVSPTYVPDLVNASLDLLIDGESGLWHLANEGSASWVELARRAAQIAGVGASRLQACSWRALGLAARRPSYSALTSERGLIMPSLDDALERYVASTKLAA